MRPLSLFAPPAAVKVPLRFFPAIGDPRVLAPQRSLMLVRFCNVVGPHANEGFIYLYNVFVPTCAGEMAEWLKAHAWKACLGETLTWVRIPLSPP
jgi:hypothetical protein